MAGPRRFGVLFVVLLWGHSLSFLACGPRGPFLRVEVQNIPQPAQTLTARTVLDGRLAPQEPAFSLNGNSSFSIGLILDEPENGQVVVAAGAHDENGCLLAVGDAPIQVRDRDTILDVILPLTVLEAPACQTQAPLILRAEPSEIDSSGRSARGERGLELLGWNFRPDMQVSIGGDPQCAELLSFHRLHIATPILTQAPGPADIEITTSDQEPVRDDAHLMIHMAPISTDWSTPLLYAPSTALLDAAVGVFAQGEAPGVVVLDDAGRIWRYRAPSALKSGANGFAFEAPGPLFSLPGFLPGQLGALTAADLDGDGVFEIGVASEVGNFIWRRGASGDYTVAFQDSALKGRDTALADLTGDGRPEWLVAGPDLRVYTNRGNGSFDALALQQLDLPTGALGVADLDGDGLRDVVAVAAPPSALLRVYYSRAGLLQGAQDYVVRGCASAGPPPRVVIARLDDDALPDLALNGSSALLLNRGSSFAYHYIAGVTPCFGGTAIAATDLNDDGTTDLAWLNQDGLRVLLNSGGARFSAGGENQALAMLPIGQATIGAAYLHMPVLDLNGDGSHDIVLGPNVLFAPPPTPRGCDPKSGG